MSNFQSNIRGIFGFGGKDINKVGLYGRNLLFYHVKSSDEWVLVKRMGVKGIKNGRIQFNYSLIDTFDSFDEVKFKCEVLLKGVS